MTNSADEIIDLIISLNNALLRAGCEPLKEVWVGRCAYDTLAQSILMQGVTQSPDAQKPRGRYNHGLISICGVKVRMDE